MTKMIMYQGARECSEGKYRRSLKERPVLHIHWINGCTKNSMRFFVYCVSFCYITYHYRKPFHCSTQIKRFYFKRLSRSNDIELCFLLFRYPVCSSHDSSDCRLSYAYITGCGSGPPWQVYKATRVATYSLIFKTLTSPTLEKSIAHIIHASCAYE